MASELVKNKENRRRLKFRSKLSHNFLTHIASEESERRLKIETHWSLSSLLLFHFSLDKHISLPLRNNVADQKVGIISLSIGSCQKSHTAEAWLESPTPEEGPSPQSIEALVRQLFIIELFEWRRVQRLRQSNKGNSLPIPSRDTINQECAREREMKFFQFSVDYLCSARMFAMINSTNSILPRTVVDCYLAESLEFSTSFKLTSKYLLSLYGTTTRQWVERFRQHWFFIYFFLFSSARECLSILFRTVMRYVFNTARSTDDD